MSLIHSEAYAGNKTIDSNLVVVLCHRVLSRTLNPAWENCNPFLKCLDSDPTVNGDSLN